MLFLDKLITFMSPNNKSVESNKIVKIKALCKNVLSEAEPKALDDLKAYILKLQEHGLSQKLSEFSNLDNKSISFKDYLGSSEINQFFESTANELGAFNKYNFLISIKNQQVSEIEVPFTGGAQIYYISQGKVLSYSAVIDCQDMIEYKIGNIFIQFFNKHGADLKIALEPNETEMESLYENVNFNGTYIIHENCQEYGKLNNIPDSLMKDCIDQLEIYGSVAFTEAL